MNGWIETKNPGVFAGVGTDDVIVRTSGISDSIVLGNASKLVAGVYVKNNNLGVRCVPSPDTALDVKGNMSVASGDNALSLSSSELAFRSASALLEVSGKGIVMSSTEYDQEWPVVMDFDGSLSAGTVVSRLVLKVGKSFPNATVLRVYASDSSVDIMGVFSVDDISSYTYVSIQGKVAKLVSAEPFSNSIHVLLKFKQDSSISELEIGPAVLYGLDSSLMDMSRLGDLKATVEPRRVENLVTMSSSIATAADGREVLKISFQGSSILDYGASEHLSLSLESSCNYENINIFVVVDKSSNEIVVAHPDPSTPLSVAYPGIVNEVVGKTHVSVRLSLVSKTFNTIEIGDVEVSFQANRVVVDASSEAHQYLTTRNSFVRISAEFNSPPEVINAVPLACTLSRNRIFMDIAPRGHAGLASGLANRVLLTTLGVPCVVSSVSYLQTQVAISLSSPSFVMFEKLSKAVSKDFLSASDGVNPATNFKIVERNEEDRGSNTIKLHLSFGSTSDALIHVPFSVGTDVNIFGFENGTATKIAFDVKSKTKNKSILFDLPGGGIGINVQDPKNATLAVGGDLDVDGSIAIGRDARIEEVRQGCMLIGSKESISFSSPQSNFDGNVSTGKLTNLAKNGVATFGDSIVAREGDYYKIVRSFDVVPDPSRAFSSTYDYELGELVRYFSVPVPADFDASTPGIAIVGLNKYRFRRSRTDSYIDLYYDAQSQNVHDQSYDVTGRLVVDVIEPATSSIARYSTFVIKAASSPTLLDRVTIRLFVEEYQLMDVAKTITFIKSNCHELPKNTFLVTSCKPSSLPGQYVLDLELLNGFDSDPSMFMEKIAFGTKLTASYVSPPFEVLASERVTNVNFWTSSSGEHVATMVPISPVTALSMKSYCISSMTLLGTKLIPREVRPSILPSAPDGAIDVVLVEQPQVIVSSASTLDVRITLKGAPATLVSLKPQGLNEAVVDVQLPDKMRLDLLKLQRYENGIVFVSGKPWRLRAVKPTNDSYVVSMTLRRLSRITLDDLLDQAVGSPLSLLPIELMLIDVLETDLVKARAMTLGEKHTFVVRDDRLIIDESVSLSREDEYARFLKDVFIQGNMIAKSMSHVSDRAFKSDIVVRPPGADLDVIRKLVVYNYDFLDTDSQRKKEFGVVADELEALLPEAVREVDGFVANVFSNAIYVGDSLIIDGKFADVVVTGSLLQISTRNSIINSVVNNNKTTYELRVQSCHENEDGKTYVTFDVEGSKALNGADYFVYGTWSTYKVANTTHLLMTCINAVNALATVLHV